jgi:hypothetical protein
MVLSQLRKSASCSSLNEPGALPKIIFIFKYGAGERKT